MAKNPQSSIIEPTPEELVVYNQLIKDIPEAQMDDLANEYFDLVSEDKIKVSFPRYIMDLLIRPIKPGDTVNLDIEDSNPMLIYCLIRKTIDDVDYLLFAESNQELLRDDVVYLFFVAGKDDIGTEIIDIVPAGEESQRIIDLMEADLDVEETAESLLGKEEQE